MHKTPRVVLNLNPRSLAVGKRNRGRMAGLYRRLGSPAARSGLGETKKRPRRTQRWSFWGSGWSDWGFPAARCGGGLLAGVQVDGGGALVAIGRRSRA